MTLGGWVLFFVIAAFLNITVAICIACADCESDAVKALAFIITEIIVIVILAVMLWWYGNTESGKRAFKTQQSNFNAGIERDVKVYDMEGELIASYSGKFDVVHDENRILFDDENGKRHVIYYPTGTVIIDER